METIHIRIKEGVTLHCIPSDKFTSDSLSVHFIVPIREETATAYSLLPRVLKRGSADYPTQELINKRLEELYAASVTMGVSKLCECEDLFVSVNMLDNRFSFDGIDITAGTLALAESLLFSPLLEDGGFSADIVAREKRLHKDRIRSQINNKSNYAAIRAREIMCENEPYRVSVLGREEEVDKITPASLYQDYLHILSAARVDVIYVGKMDSDTVKQLLHGFFDRLAPRSFTDVGEVLVDSVKKLRRVTETVAAKQGNLVLGFRTPAKTHEDLCAMQLFEMIYGASPVSKLFMNVREKLSLCYHCSARADRYKGVMLVTAGIENKNADLAESEILKQLDEIREGNITDLEIACAKEAIYDILRTIPDSQIMMESWCLQHARRESEETPAALMEEIKALTREDVVRVARKISLDTVYFLEGSGAGEEEDDEDV